MKTADHTITQSTPHDAKYLHEIPMRLPPMRALKQVLQVKNWRFSISISLYFRNGTRYGRGYCGRLIENHAWSIECCHFQMTLNKPYIIIYSKRFHLVNIGSFLISFDRVYQVCHGVDVDCYVKIWFVLHQACSESHWSLLLWYSEQMLDAIKHVTGDNFVFQQDSYTPAHCARNTVQLL